MDNKTNELNDFDYSKYITAYEYKTETVSTQTFKQGINRYTDAKPKTVPLRIASDEAKSATEKVMKDSVINPSEGLI